jgi:hypothetical protein
MNPEIASFESYVKKIMQERDLSRSEAWEAAQREQPHLYAAMAKNDPPLTPHLGMQHKLNSPVKTTTNAANGAAAAMQLRVGKIMAGGLSYGEAWDLCMSNPENAELVRAMRS